MRYFVVQGLAGWTRTSNIGALAYHRLRFPTPSRLSLSEVAVAQQPASANAHSVWRSYIGTESMSTLPVVAELGPQCLGVARGIAGSWLWLRPHCCPLTLT